jgi:hypothetical protein
MEMGKRGVISIAPQIETSPANRGPQLRSPRLAAQDRQFVPKHQDLQLLRPRRPTKEHHQPEQTANDHVRERPRHTRPPKTGIADATPPPAQHRTAPPRHG